MSVSIILKNKVNLNSPNMSFKKEDKDGNYYINAYNSSVLSFKLKYDSETTRDNEFQQIIEDIKNRQINIDNYTGTIIEVC